MTFFTATPQRFANPDAHVDTSAQIAAWSARWDRKADALADDLRIYRARCDAALARTQEHI